MSSLSAVQDTCSFGPLVRAPRCLANPKTIRRRKCQQNTISTDSHLLNRRAHDEMRKTQLHEDIAAILIMKMQMRLLNEPEWMVSLFSHLAFPDICRTVCNTIDAEWNEAFKLTSFAGIYHGIPMKPWFQKICLSVEELKILNRLSANFSHRKCFLGKFGATPSPDYDRCGVEETNEHTTF